MQVHRYGLQQNIIYNKWNIYIISYLLLVYIYFSIVIFGVYVPSWCFIVVLLSIIHFILSFNLIKANTVIISKLMHTVQAAMMSYKKIKCLHSGSVGRIKLSLSLQVQSSLRITVIILPIPPLANVLLAAFTLPPLNKMFSLRWLDPDKIFKHC